MFSGVMISMRESSCRGGFDISAIIRRGAKRRKLASRAALD
jgi:hypothetical protein